MILNRLRLETRAQHDKLDQHPLMLQLMSPSVSHQQYQALLSKFLGFYQPLEPLLAPFTHWSTLGINLTERRKTPWILQDLEQLGASTHDLPLCNHLDWIHDEAGAMGTFYVIEGSTLGGQVIRRHVADHLDLTPAHGLAFFSSYGELVGQRWKETRQALVRFSEQTSADDIMIEAAKQTFSTLTAWLDS